MLFHNFLSNILFYLFIYINSQLNSMLFLKKFLKLIIYILNLALCLHLAFNSLLLFNNFFGSGKSKMCIFSSKHRLHLLSKDREITQFKKWLRNKIHIQGGNSF